MILAIRWSAVLLTTLYTTKTNGLTLKTRSILPGVSKDKAFDFLARPINWPTIVASSVGVKGSRTTQPMRVGETVDEIFGLPPVLPLSVTWRCAQAFKKAGILDVISDDGLDGVTSDARMLFNVSGSTDACVELAMSFTPTSPLAVLAVPVLILDNALALKVLLPRALRQPALTGGDSSVAREKSGGGLVMAETKAPLNEFRRLMGVLYGVAGLLHFLDLEFGGSQLLVAAGSPPFESLPFSGQALALLWCAAGPLSAALLLAPLSPFSKVAQSADTSTTAGSSLARRQLAPGLGLVLYGVVEVACASTVELTCHSDGVLVNALGVQAFVAASWLYSRQGD